MTSEIEKYAALQVTVIALWKGSVNCPSFSTWFETASFLDFLSTTSQCNKAAKNELVFLSKLAGSIGRIKSKQRILYEQ